MRNSARPLGRAWPARLAGALLCLAVAVIHVTDQGGFPGSKAPKYVAVLYYVLETAGVLTAVLLLTRGVRPGWFLAVGVAAGPILGYLLSRGPGLPDYSSDIGNWTEPLGLLSLAVEGLLLILSVSCWLSVRKASPRIGAAS
ncbi:MULTISPECIES: hypothetical protein [Streptomyces]|uniref:Integral membrane protein n=1 Tax=Streptomyces lonegramiae TaxID=3075524 RepID=A0ABU2XF69_9ACTN|nr:hypothetical protein [Streptomyces sp. DSM 41529]MDT0543568.1 hypothetical protein [Streptomyces sp. DSM 41529]